MAANPRIDDLRKRLEKEPGSRLFAQLAEELRKEGEVEEAIRICREGLQKHPNYPSARMTLGRALLDGGDVAAARTEFEAVLKGAPDNILASRFLGECLEGLGDLAGAQKRYKATLAMAPGDKQVQARLGEVEARLAGGVPPAAVPASPAAKAAPAPAVAAPSVRLPRPAAGDAPLPAPPAPAVEPAAQEPPPIRLVDADESFELERPHEATARTTVPGTAPEAGDTSRSPEAGEPPPIPLVAVDEEFEIEKPYEAPGAAAQAPTGPSQPAGGASEFVFEDESITTVPFRTAPALEEAGPGETPQVQPKDPVGATAPPAPSAAGARPADTQPVASAPAGEIASPTLAEVYFSQGVYDKAIAVYRELLQREPGNERARARLFEIEALDRRPRAEGQPGASSSGADDQAARRRVLERTVSRLEGFLATIKRG